MNAKTSKRKIPRAHKPYRVVPHDDDGGAVSACAHFVRFHRNLAVSELTGARFRLAKYEWVEGRDYEVQKREGPRQQILMPGAL